MVLRELEDNALHLAQMSDPLRLLIHKALSVAVWV